VSKLIRLLCYESQHQSESNEKSLVQFDHEKAVSNYLGTQSTFNLGGGPAGLRVNGKSPIVFSHLGTRCRSTRRGGPCRREGEKRGKGGGVIWVETYFEDPDSLQLLMTVAGRSARRRDGQGGAGARRRALPARVWRTAARCGLSVWRHHHRESVFGRPEGAQPPNTPGGNTTRGETAHGETHPPTPY